MSAQVAADLRAAAEVLRRDGWTQKAFHRVVDGRVCYCLAGALERVVASDTHAATERWRADIEHVGRQLGVGAWPISVYDWNDAPGRTADEVIAALEAAADAAEADQ